MPRFLVFAWLPVVLLVGAGVHAHGDIHGQIDALTQRLERGPPSALLLLRRGELHAVHGDWQRAEADLAAAARLDPGFAEVDLALGRMCQQAHRPACAEAALGRFLARHPHHAEALFGRGLARAALGRREAALEDLDRALALLDSPQPDHYLARAEVQVTGGEAGLAQALQGLDEGTARLGAVAALQEKAVELELRRGRPLEALERWDRAFAALPRADLWLSRRAELLEHAGRPAEARAAREQALAALESLPEHVRRRPASLALRTRLQAGLAETPSDRSGGRPDP